MAPPPTTEPRRPSLGITILLGVATLLFGAVLGAVSLISQQVEEVSSLPPPEDREPGLVYYVRGSDAPGARWRLKREQLVQQAEGTVRFTEQDLNDWARNHFQTALGPSGQQERPAAETPERALLGLELKVSPPNFDIREDGLQVSTYLEFPAISRSRKFVYRVVGDFAASGDGVVRFVPREGTLGQAALVDIPGLGPLLHGRFEKLFSSAPEWQALAEHWGAISAITVEGGQLVLSIE